MASGTFNTHQPLETHEMHATHARANATLSCFVHVFLEKTSWGLRLLIPCICGGRDICAETPNLLFWLHRALLDGVSNGVNVLFTSQVFACIYIYIYIYGHVYILVYVCRHT